MQKDDRAELTSSGRQRLWMSMATAWRLPTPYRRAVRASRVRAAASVADCSAEKYTHAGVMTRDPRTRSRRVLATPCHEVSFVAALRKLVP